MSLQEPWGSLRDVADTGSFMASQRFTISTHSPALIYDELEERRHVFECLSFSEKCILFLTVLWNTGMLDRYINPDRSDSGDHCAMYFARLNLLPWLVVCSMRSAPGSSKAAQVGIRYSQNVAGKCRGFYSFPPATICTKRKSAIIHQYLFNR